MMQQLKLASQCRLQNLRVALCLNPDTPALAKRLEANPALLSGTTAIWLDGGGAEQQLAVAAAGMSDAAPALESGCAEDADSLTATLQGLHSAADQVSRTAPHHFAALLRQCLHIFAMKKAETLEQIDFLQVLLAPRCLC